MLRFSLKQNIQILRVLRACNAPQAHASVWSRRVYAPMLIHTPEFESVRTWIATTLPDYAITFDVIFESDGRGVEWHVDHESLGPFIVADRWRAIKEEHFLTLHTNLTADGGNLVTWDSPLASYLHFLVISTFGIFSVAHRLMLLLTRPFFGWYHKTWPNESSVANLFDNARLHAVNPGASRVSYVIRLVKRGCVTISKDSVNEGIRRSPACSAFVPLLSTVGEAPVDVGSLPWHTVARISPPSNSPN